MGGQRGGRQENEGKKAQRGRETPSPSTAECEIAPCASRKVCLLAWWKVSTGNRSWKIAARIHHAAHARAWCGVLATVAMCGRLRGRVETMRAHASVQAAASPGEQCAGCANDICWNSANDKRTRKREAPSITLVRVD